MTTLPQAIQLVLPMLASDGGRARVQTLLAIQGAGPDYVRQYLTDIDATLGTASPGTAALADLIHKAEDAGSTPSTVERQHFISQGVLRQFVEPSVAAGNWPSSTSPPVRWKPPVRTGLVTSATSSRLTARPPKNCGSRSRAI